MEVGKVSAQTSYTNEEISSARRYVMKKISQRISQSNDDFNKVHRKSGRCFVKSYRKNGNAIQVSKTRLVAKKALLNEVYPEAKTKIKITDKTL